MNIPIVGQTFEIDGYKSIECTADANADAKAFAKANGIPFAEAKYILETLYGSARQEKVTGGVTDTTADEDGEVDGTDDEIMDAIDNLTTALAGNESIDNDILTKITELLKKLTGTTTANTTDVSDGVANTATNANIDWTTLEVEGKGVNLNNIANILQNAVADYKATNKNINYEAIYKSLSTEEKAVVDKFLPNGASKTELIYLFNFFNNGGKDNRHGADVTMVALAAADSDGDGFLSDSEIATISNVIPKIQNPSDYFDKIGKSKIESNGVITTTINGKTVYFASYSGTTVGGQYISLTEDEMVVLDQFLNNEEKNKYVGSSKQGDDIQPIWEALNAEFVQKSKDDNIRGYQVLTNSAGITSVIFENGSRCGKCDDRLYEAYKKVKEAMAKNNA